MVTEDFWPSIYGIHGEHEVRLNAHYTVKVVVPRGLIHQVLRGKISHRGSKASD